MQELHGTGRGSERQPEIIRDCERHVATLWDQRDRERKPVNMGDSERHAETLWHCKTLLETASNNEREKNGDRRPATIGDSERHAATPWEQRNSEG